ncbi:hypothetical protein B6N60_02010 [Richelia sinica FACHB-800]|uniref:phospholipase D n=1 Tax=Richelia sinica FACHB-800 TaxID=1357546 RepID=A0A975T764_9NOST|nr:phospholipase D-like domain-containing protein [Richelia sinica]MBD2665997.1 DUF1669 domain-containing protein [Richelia sinica FACHB-800]QXE23320.1 hypothetical protein B6N60_02010 [Richelia sinica FACHB-800]
MKLSEYTINQLKTIVSGDHQLKLTKPKTGKDLVYFFNSFGERDVYDTIFNDKFYSRQKFIVDKFKQLNGTKTIKNILEKIVNDNDDKEKIANIINEIIKNDNYYLDETDGIYSVISQDSYDEEIEIEVSFEENQGKIIKAINQAKFLIWVAVAWFTDEVLFNKLIDKQAQGINVQVIISDDNINNNLKFEENFETYRIPKSGKFDNIMHHKFCVIDLCTVINGSYNWTKKAQFNHENLNIISNRTSVEKYAHEFINLKKSIKNK